MNASRIFTKIGLLLLAANVTAAPHLWAAPPAPMTRVSPPPAAVQIDQSRQTLLLVNQSRAEKGLAPLEWDEGLAKAAQEHAKLLAQSHRLSHQFAGELSVEQRISANARVGRSGENVAVNYDSAGAHVAFMQSPEHKANILNPEFDTLGVAVVSDGDLLYFVEDFAHRRTVLSNSDAARLIVQRFAEIRSETVAPPLRDTYQNNLEDWTCSAARNNNKLTVQEHAPVQGARLILAFSTSNAADLPPEVSRVAADPAFDRYSVGICFAQTARYPAGRYFVTLAFFQAGAPYMQDATAADPAAIRSELRVPGDSHLGE